MWVMRGEDEDEPKYVLGIQLMPVDDTLREHLDLQEGDGLVVAGVLAESPAEKAGFQEHDVVIRVDGKDVESVEDIVKSVQTAGENEEELAVTVVRSGDRKTITVVPAKRKPSEHAEAEKHGSHEGHAKMSEDHERVLQQLREEIKELRGAIKELKRALHDDD
jgi:serine protease Do